jgi:phosphoribosylamine--glycine ligase
VEIFDAIAEARVGSLKPRWNEDSSVCIVAASGGYPSSFEKGKPISGLEDAKAIDGINIFHAGTVRDEQGSFLTSGGRVLAVTARAATLGEARNRAYEAINKISFEQMHFRTDIARAWEE